MNELSICFIGTGKINVKHLRLVRKLAPKTTLAVASRSAEPARRFQERHGLRDAFASYEEAIASSYDTLVVGTPPRGHAALVQRCIAADKNVLIEKPIVNSMEELRTLWPAMKGTARAMMVAENVHYAPFFQRLKELLRQQDLGRPIYLELTKLGRSSPAGWRADPEEMPLGALHEGGVHWIRRLLDLAAVFEGGDSSGVLGVRTYGPGRPLTHTPGEDTSMIMARHRSGLVSRLFHTWAIPWRFPPFDASRVLLERGALYFDARGVYGRLYGRRRRFLWPRIRDAGGYRAMWQNYLAHLQHDEPLALSMENIFEDFAYMDAAYRSIESGQEEVPSPIPGQ